MTARVHRVQGRVVGVDFVNVPSWVVARTVPVTTSRGELRVAVAYGGAFYATLPAAEVGLSVTPDDLGHLIALGREIKWALNDSEHVVHPTDPRQNGIYGTIFTAPAQHPDAHLRNVTIFADAEVDRSPCGTGTAAVMAVLSEMGVLSEDAPFVHESIVGTLFAGRIAARCRVGEFAAIVPEIQGSAWITGEHTFLIDGDDPLRAGFRL